MPSHPIRFLAAFAVVLTTTSCTSGRAPSVLMSPSAGRASPSAVVARVTVGAGPQDLTYAGGALWVTNFDDGTVSRVDPAAGKVRATIRVGAGPITAISASGAIWVANYNDGSVSRIDPATNAVTATVTTGAKPVGLSTVGSTLWVFNQGDATATLVDTRTAKSTATVPINIQAGWTALYRGRLWIPDFGGGTNEVLAFDPATHKVVARVHTGAAPITVSFAGGSGWVSNTGDATVTRFDPADGKVLATIPIAGGAIGPLLATTRAVWVSVYGGAALVRIDPATNAVTASIPVGSQPQNLAIVGAALWLIEGGSDDIVRIRQP